MVRSGTGMLAVCSLGALCWFGPTRSVEAIVSEYLKYKIAPRIANFYGLLYSAWMALVHTQSRLYIRRMPAAKPQIYWQHFQFPGSPAEVSSFGVGWLSPVFVNRTLLSGAAFPPLRLLATFVKCAFDVPSWYCTGPLIRCLVS
jgi:hypothetical protein